jgi:hypothetical protein
VDRFFLADRTSVAASNPVCSIAVRAKRRSVAFITRRMCLRAGVLRGSCDEASYKSSWLADRNMLISTGELVKRGLDNGDELCTGDCG